MWGLFPDFAPRGTALAISLCLLSIQASQAASPVDGTIELSVSTNWTATRHTETCTVSGGSMVCTGRGAGNMQFESRGRLEGTTFTASGTLQTVTIYDGTCAQTYVTPFKRVTQFLADGTTRESQSYDLSTPTQGGCVTTTRSWNFYVGQYSGSGTWRQTTTARSQPAPKKPIEKRPAPASTWSSEDEAAAASAAAALSALGLVALAGMLLRIQAGQPQTKYLSDLLAAMRGLSPPDPFEAWKSKYTGLGWRYIQENGIARFEPVAGSRNEQGWLYDPEKGDFIPPISQQAAPQAVPHDGDPDPASGKVWSSSANAWVNRDYYEAERARTGRYEAAQAAEREQAAAADRAAAQEQSARTAQMAHDIAAQKAAMAAAERERAAQSRAMAEKLRKAYAAEGRSDDEINRLSASGNVRALIDLYAEQLRKTILRESGEAASQGRWATALDAGYYASVATLAAARTGLMVVGGPAGTVVGMGLIQAAQEGATVSVAGGSAVQVLKATATGMLSGVKDGAIGRFTNLPGVGPATRVLLPAAADAAEAYLRTGDARVAVSTGILSTVAGKAGQALGGMRNVVVRQGAQTLLGGATGAAGNLLAGGDAREGLLVGMLGSTGSSAGGKVAQGLARSASRSVQVGGVTLKPKEFQLNLEASANAAKGKALVEDYANARTPQERAAATKAILENRDAKLLMKGGPIKEGLKSQFAADTEQTRTRPLFEGTARELNGQKTVDGRPRFVIRDSDPLDPARTIERPIRPSDFRSGSGTAGGAPGQDLDLYTDKKIVDLSTGRPARPADLDGAVSQTCRDLGISRSKQEINFISGSHPEAFTLKPGETPKEFIARAGDLSGHEAQSVTEVNTVKLLEAKVLHGDGAAGIAEQCRTATKDYTRLTEKLLDSHPNARLPEAFTVRNEVSGETPLQIIAAVGNGTLPPGTGNARFQAMTGMNLEEGTLKMASWAEGIAKGSGADSHLISGARPDETMQAILRNALRTGKEVDRP